MQTFLLSLTLSHKPASKSFATNAARGGVGRTRCWRTAVFRRGTGVSRVWLGDAHLAPTGEHVDVVALKEGAEIKVTHTWEVVEHEHGGGDSREG